MIVNTDKTMNSSGLSAFGGATYSGGQESNATELELESFLLMVLGPRQMENRWESRTIAILARSHSGEVIIR